MVPWPTWRPQQSCGKQSDALQLPLVETAGRLARGAVTACVLVGRCGQEPGCVGGLSGNGTQAAPRPKARACEGPGHLSCCSLNSSLPRV